MVNNFWITQMLSNYPKFKYHEHFQITVQVFAHVSVEIYLAFLRLHYLIIVLSLNQCNCNMLFLIFIHFSHYFLLQSM